MGFLVHMTGISGKKLEQAAIELLSLGSVLKWERKEIGASQAGQAGWEVYKPTTRALMKQYCLFDQFRQPDLITAPSKTTFPVVDFVFFWCGKVAQPVVAFQCTWSKKHSVTLRGLRELRRSLMKISDNLLDSPNFSK